MIRSMSLLLAMEGSGGAFLRTAKLESEAVDWPILLPPPELFELGSSESGQFLNHSGELGIQCNFE